MGQFDKQQTPSPDASKKKVVIAVALAIALAGVVGAQVFKGTPRTASADTPGAAMPEMVAATVPDETVSQVLTDLANDPTAKLLRGSSGFDPAMVTPPHDPFHVSEQWRSSLVRFQHNTDVPRVEPRVHSNTSAPVLEANTENLKLQGIFVENQHYTAIVNGEIVHAGKTLGKIRILEILQDRIIVQHADSPYGPRTEMMLKPKLNP